MRIQAVSREVSVVCLIIYSKREVAIREDEVSQVEVTDETLGGVGVVTITELTIEYQTVVQQSSTQNAFVFCIIESLVASRNVGSEIPLVTVYQTGKHGVDLLRDRSAPLYR